MSTTEPPGVGPRSKYPIAAETADRVALLVLGALFAVFLLDSPGTHDVDHFYRWQGQTLKHGLVDGYRGSETGYPPLSFVLLWLTGKASRAAGIPRVLGFKISLLVFLALTTAVFLAWSRDLLFAAGLLWILVPSAMAQGYIDVYYALPLFGALWAFSKGRHGWGALLFAAACLVKWQPLLIAPFLAVHLLRQRAVRASLPVVLAPGLALVAILVFVFGLDVVRALGRGLTHPNLSANAMNFHWILTYFLRVLHPGVFGGLEDGAVERLRPGMWEAIWLLRLPFFAFYLSTLAVFARRPRTFEGLLSFSFVGFVSYFVFATGVHENHLFVACLLGLVHAWRERSALASFLTWSTVNHVNQLMFGGFSGQEPPFGHVFLIDLTVPLAVLVVVSFLALFLSRVWDDPGKTAEPAGGPSEAVAVSS